MKYVIFYSWQSDLPNNTNRGFIESVIKKAIDNLANSESYDLEPSIDRDTLGIPGAPNITQAITDKIRTCDAFVADISIVTGAKERNERPSPNPNVLLELGYAIALLGWEKIILFCNDIYGTDEDLPFDIRQHRRIGYQLAQEEPKAAKKNTLAKHFKERLVELLQSGKSNLSKKMPLIDVSWDHSDFTKAPLLEADTNSKMIQLTRADDVTIEIDSVKQEILRINETGKNSDLNWRDKKDEFLCKANEFIAQLGDNTKRLNYLINCNSSKTHSLTLSVDNDGNAPASDIRVEIPIPEWLIAFKKFPDENDTPLRPNMPVPVAPKEIDTIALLRSTGLFGSINHKFPEFKMPLILENNTRTSACHLKENEIQFWADRLLHKHEITNRKDRFYLMAMPNAPTGEVTLKGKAFCSEYDDWKEVELIINIV